MSEAKSVMLVLGASYTHKKIKYMKGEPKIVNKDTYDELMAIKVRGGSKFIDTKPKELIRKPDDTKLEPKSVVIPTFRSKAELAEYSEETYGLEFGGDLKELKMKDMIEAIEDHLTIKENELEQEPTVEV